MKDDALIENAPDSTARWDTQKTMDPAANWPTLLTVPLFSAAVYMSCIVSPPSLMDDVDAVEAHFATNADTLTPLALWSSQWDDQKTLHASRALAQIFAGRSGSAAAVRRVQSFHSSSPPKGLTGPSAP